MEENLIKLEITPAVWMLSFELARKSRAAGHTIPPTDILIAACARHHGADIEHADSHFNILDKIR